MMPPRVELSSSSVQAIESIIAQAEVLGPKSVPHESYLHVFKQVYTEYVQALKAREPGTEAFEVERAQTWAERFPDFRPRKGEMPEAPRAKALVHRFGGKVVTDHEVANLNGYASITVEHAPEFMQREMVETGWARVSSLANGIPSAWVIREPVEDARSSVPTDGVTFHIVEHLGGLTVSISQVYEVLEKAAMATNYEHARAHMARAVEQGWAEVAARRDDDMPLAWNIKEMTK